MLGGTVLGGLLVLGPVYLVLGPVIHYLVKRGALKAGKEIRNYMKLPETREVLVKHLAGLKDDKPALALFGRKQRNELAGLVATARRLNTEKQIAEVARAAEEAKANRQLNVKLTDDTWPEVVSLTKALLDALDAGSAAALPGDKAVLKRTNLAVEERLLQLEELEQPGKALGPEQSQARENLTALRTIIAEKLS